VSVPAAAIALSLSYYTVPELTPPAAVHVAADAGFCFVGLRLLHGQPGRDLAPLLADAALRRETMRAMADRGLDALDASGARLVADSDVDAFDSFLDAAAEMGARHILATADDAERARLIERTTRLCEKAAARGLTIDLEFVPWMAVGDLRAARRLVDDVRHPALGIAVDALHFHRSGSSADELARVPRDRLRYVQLCDAPAERPAAREALLHEATKERLLPGDGAIDLVTMLRAMPRGIPVALEIPMAVLARAIPAAERLARIIAATRRVLARAYD
jgi:sugar phosphate isomerase/epimerase